MTGFYYLHFCVIDIIGIQEMNKNVGMIRKSYQVIVFTALVLVGCTSNGTNEKKQTPSVTVEYQKVTQSVINHDLKVSGNIEGNKTVRLGFLVAGKLDFIAVQEGETINKGAVLASLDSESYEIALEMADANLSQMQDDYNRIKVLHDKENVSESDLVKITNGLRGAKAQRRLHAKNLEDTRLYSPVKGVLLKRGAEEGEIIDKGMPVFAVSDIYTVKVNAAVPEMDLKNIGIRDTAEVYIAALDSTFTGSIIEIGTLADAATRTFNVKIALKNDQLLIRPGMTAEVVLVTGTASEVKTLPVECILRNLDNSSYVFVADTIKNKAFKRSVSLGAIYGNSIEIVTGLNAGESVIIKGQHKLSNGCSITF